MLIEDYFCGLIGSKLLGPGYKQRETYVVDIDDLNYKSFLPNGTDRFEGEIKFRGGATVCSVVSISESARFIIKIDCDLSKYSMSTSWREFYENFESKNKEPPARMSFATKSNGTSVRIVGREAQVRNDLDDFLAILRENAPLFK